MDITSFTNTFKSIFKISETTHTLQDSATKTAEENFPSQELVAEFESYLHEPNTITQQHEISNTNQLNSHQQIIDNNTIPEQPLENINPSLQEKAIKLNYKIEEPTKIHLSENIMVDPPEYFHEIQDLLKHIENNTLSNTQLFRLQYLTNMLNVQIIQNNSIAKSQHSLFETILKQQG